MCVEVIEHMTLAMLRDLLRDLARISEAESLFPFDTGLPPYVKNEDMVISTRLYADTALATR